jgi:hypothetical protein
MKKTFLAASCIAAALVILAGCATPVVTPGTPAQPAVTNAITGVVTPPVAAAPATTNYIPNATVTEVVSAGQGVSTALPQPYGTALSAILGLVALAAGYVAQKKNGQLSTANQVTTAIIQGVEAAGTAAAAVKASVATVSKANGVSDAVEAAVNQVTGSQ